MCLPKRSVVHCAFRYVRDTKPLPSIRGLHVFMSSQEKGDNNNNNDNKDDNNSNNNNNDFTSIALFRVKHAQLR